MYDYKVERATVFTEEGQITFLNIRDKVKKILALAGAARMEQIIAGFGGDSWFLLACVDRLVELREIREITPQGVAGQDRVFVSAVTA